MEEENFASVLEIWVVTVPCVGPWWLSSALELVQTNRHSNAITPVALLHISPSWIHYYLARPFWLFGEYSDLPSAQTPPPLWGWS